MCISGQTGEWGRQVRGNREGNREWMGQDGLGNGMDRSGGNRDGWVMLDGGLGWTGQGEIGGHRKDERL